jgi:hypothetical protein
LPNPKQALDQIPGVNKMSNPDESETQTALKDCKPGKT